MNDNDGPDADAEAAHWYARLLTKPVSRETLEAFFAWRRGAGHGDAFDAVERFHARVGDLADRPAMLSATAEAFSRGASRSRWRPATIGLAAAIIVCVLAGAAALGPWPIRGEVYATKVGQQSVVNLADGSKLMLDTDTRLAVRFTNAARHITLSRGQAYFTVAHDAARPFLVDAGDARVLATGTQFDVRRDDALIDVTLVEGSVRIDGPGAAPTRLRAGQQLRMRAHQAPQVRTVSTVAVTAWKTGRIILVGATLRQAIAEVNRYTGRPVRLDAPRFADARLSGSIEAGDVQAFVTAVTALLPLKAVRGDDGSVSLND